ncbi:MAG: DUF58 domain-containing protein [Bacteroidales bacterium]|nr:DUF58 domain-containing protein [Bacteroidales bacterium]
MDSRIEKGRVERYRNLELLARQVVEGYIVGLHKSPFHGFSVEFSEHRLYNTGESTKHIDWKLYGRTDKMFVKTFEEETNLRCQIVVDTSASMYFPVERHGDAGKPNKITFAVYAAAVLVEMLRRQRDAFGLALLSDKIDVQTPVQSRAANQTLIYSQLDRLLAPYQPDNGTPHTTRISEPLHLLAEQLHRRSLVVIFTDAWVDGQEQARLFDAIRHLRHCKHEVILFHVLDYSQEVQLDFDNRPHLFIDMESGRKLKLSPAALAEKYNAAMRKRVAEIKDMALAHNIDYVEVDVGKGFDQVLQPYLFKRGRMM